MGPYYNIPGIIDYFVKRPIRGVLYGGSVDRFRKALGGYHAAGLEIRPFQGSLMRAFLERLSRSGVSRPAA